MEVALEIHRLPIGFSSEVKTVDCALCYPKVEKKNPVVIVPRTRVSGEEGGGLIHQATALAGAPMQVLDPAQRILCDSGIQVVLALGAAHTIQPLANEEKRPVKHT